MLLSPPAPRTPRVPESGETILWMGVSSVDLASATCRVPHPPPGQLAAPSLTPAPCPSPAGTPVNRIPIMAKQVLDLFMLYVLVTEKGGLVEVINKKLWREITKGLNLPTSITSAAFTLRTQ